MLAKIIGETVRNPLSSGFVLNVNLPHLPVGEIKGDCAVFYLLSFYSLTLSRSCTHSLTHTQVFACAIREKAVIKSKWRKFP